jgi:hypothetical protein
MGIPSAPYTQSSAYASHEFESAGYYVANDFVDGSSWYCLVDAGPHGGDRTGHAHTDLGHIELAVGEHAVLVDPGCAIYASDPARRDWYRSLRAHASVTVDGLEPATPRGPFGWARVAPTPAVTVSDCDGLWTCTLAYDVESTGLSHERCVVLVRAFGLIVVDRLSGTGEHSLRWNWPLGSRLHSDAIMGSAAVVASGVQMFWSCSAPGLTAALVDAHRSRTYGQEEPVSAISCELRSSTWPVEMVTVLCPTAMNGVLISRTAGSTSICIGSDRQVRLVSGAAPSIVHTDLPTRDEVESYPPVSAIAGDA